MSAAAAPITALAFTTDGQAVLVGSQEGVEVRSWPDLQQLRRLPTELSHIHDIVVAKERLAVVGGAPSEFGAVEVFAWPELNRISRTIRHDDVIFAADWNADGAELATASADAMVQVGGLAADDVPRRLAGHSRGVLAVKFLTGTSLLITAGLDNSLRVWDLETGRSVRTMDNHRGAVRDLAVLPGEHALPMIASSGADGTVRFWQPTIGRLVRYAKLPTEPLSIAWLPDQQRLAVSCLDGHLRIVRLDDVTLASDQPAIDGWAYEVAVSPDGTGVVIGGGDGRLRRVGVRP